LGSGHAASGGRLNVPAQAEVRDAEAALRPETRGEQVRRAPVELDGLEAGAVRLVERMLCERDSDPCPARIGSRARDRKMCDSGVVAGMEGGISEPDPAPLGHEDHGGLVSQEIDPVVAQRLAPRRRQARPDGWPHLVLGDRACELEEDLDVGRPGPPNRRAVGRRRLLYPDPSARMDLLLAEAEREEELWERPLRRHLDDVREVAALDPWRPCGRVEVRQQLRLLALRE